MATTHTSNSAIGIVYRGTFVHSTTEEALQILEDALLGVDTEGKVLWLLWVFFSVSLYLITLFMLSVVKVVFDVNFCPRDKMIFRLKQLCFLELVPNVILFCKNCNVDSWQFGLIIKLFWKRHVTSTTSKYLPSDGIDNLYLNISGSEEQWELYNFREKHLSKVWNGYYRLLLCQNIWYKVFFSHKNVEDNRTEITLYTIICCGL